MIMINREIRLRRRPTGAPSADDFEMAESPVPVPAPGQVLVQTLYLSLDPALRPRMNAVSDYAGAVAIGETIPSPALGVVVASRSPLFAEGDHVFGFLGWRSFAAIDASALRRIFPERAPLPQWMSLLGLSSFTAWIGLEEIGRPKPGETVVVSAAAGATGAIVGQIARIRGARAVGVAGGADKCRYVVEELGFDACVDYRAPDFVAHLDQACPDGIDVDFENVGGSVFRTVFVRMNLLGRVVLCGMVSEYGGATSEASRPIDVVSIIETMVDGQTDLGHTVFVQGERQALVLGKVVGLKRAFSNVIGNAVKYANTVAVTVSIQADSIQIDVIDDGPGIPLAELGRVFEAFYRIEGSRSRETGGAGLGLTIARAVLRAHGGSIQLKSTLPNGILVRISLPKMAASTGGLNESLVSPGH